MKVVYICDNIARYGGVERIWADKMNCLADKLDYDIYLITVCQNSHPYIFPLSDNITKIDIGIRPYARYRYPHPLRDFVLLWLEYKITQKLQDTIDRIQPDIVIGYTHTEERRYVMRLKGKFVKILESHLARSYHYPITTDSSLKDRIISLIENKRIDKAASKCNVLVALSSEDANLWTTAKKVVVIPNFTRLSFKGSVPTTSHNRIINLGRLAEQKNHKALIEAWHKLENRYTKWNVDIFGYGPLHEDLTRSIMDIGVSRLHIHPFTKNVVEELLKSDFFVLSSTYEGFGLVLIEAMTCGLPCIAFNCPYGPADIIKDKEDGLLVEPDNVEALAEAISWMIEHEDERKEMGRRAKENVKRFSPNIVMAQWDRLFHELVDETTPHDEVIQD